VNSVLTRLLRDVLNHGLVREGLLKINGLRRVRGEPGSAPDDADGCGSTTNVGNQRLVPYTADYYFFRKDQ
jgi:hypothetical protein